METVAVHAFDFQKIHAGQDGVVDLQDPAVVGLLLQQVTVGPDVDRLYGIL